jgi:hypothetical protein
MEELERNFRQWSTIFSGEEIVGLNTGKTCEKLLNVPAWKKK